MADLTLPGAIIMLVGLDFVDKPGEFATYARVLADAGVECCSTILETSTVTALAVG